MRAEALAGRLEYADLTVYDDWQSLISAGNCDVISIATAPMLRSDPLLAALDQGCHVLVEKPISVGVPEARVMARRGRGGEDCHGMLFQLAIRAGLSDS
jgi:predicted dehydrogenase